MFYFASRDSSVGVVIRYGLDGPGIESRVGDIPHWPQFYKIVNFAQKIYLYTSQFSKSKAGIYLKSALTCWPSNLRRSVFTVR
jgi:hypothetical protein